MERSEGLKKGFTLIELLIAVAITAVIAAAVYFSLDTALESWRYTKDQLALQKVLNEVAEKITSGTVESFGMKDSLEILAAGKTQIEFVPPWTDDTHTVREADFVYTLNTRIKPGTTLPIAETKLRHSDEYLFVGVDKIEEGLGGGRRVRLKELLPQGNPIRFTYHPDAKSNSDTIKNIWWDEEDKEVYSSYKGELEDISKNPFEVKITKMELRYYDNENNLITESEWVDEKDLILITGIELLLDAELGQYKKTLLGFAGLRNAPMRSGYLTLSEGVRIKVADSEKIHTLRLMNITGVSSKDILRLRATPDSGTPWSIKIVFENRSGSEPKIAGYTIEYPPGEKVFTESPGTKIEAGLNLLALGTNGKYDYDLDEDVKNVVILKGEVSLEVERMDIEGAGLFVRP